MQAFFSGYGGGDRGRIFNCCIVRRILRLFKSAAIYRESFQSEQFSLDISRFELQPVCTCYVHIVFHFQQDFQDLTKTKWTDFNFFYITTGNGKRLLTYFYQMFGSAQLEDTWIPICCVTTNLTSQDVRVDRSGIVIIKCVHLP